MSDTGIVRSMSFGIPSRCWTNKHLSPCNTVGATSAGLIFLEIERSKPPASFTAAAHRHIPRYNFIMSVCSAASNSAASMGRLKLIACVFSFPLSSFQVYESTENIMLSYAREGIGKCRMSRTALSVSLVNMWLWLFMPVMHGSLSISQILLHPQVRIVTFFMWFILLSWVLRPWLPSAPSPRHQLWQSQPLSLQWEAAFFQRDDLLCLCRGWHWGRDPSRGLDSTLRMLWTRSASCHPNSAAHMCAEHAPGAGERGLHGSLFSSQLTLEGPAHIICTFMVN